MGNQGNEGSTQMRCVRCNAETRFHRAVVRLADGTITGGLCGTCDPRTDASVGHEHSTGGTMECDLCDGVAVYALPEHHLEVSVVEGAEHDQSGYPIDEDTPLRCDIHGPITAVGEIPEGQLSSGAVSTASDD